MHREIAIVKIAAYLGRGTPVVAGNLPDRLAADAGAPAIGNVNEYRTYDVFLRGAAHTDAQTDAFVGEMQKAKNLASINL